MPTTPQSYNNPYSANTIFDAVAGVNRKKSPFTPTTNQRLVDQPAAPIKTQPTNIAPVAPAVQPAATPVVAEPVQPAVEPVVEPTAGELFKDISIPTSPIGDTTAFDAEKRFIDEITQPVNEEQIREQAIAQMQAQIDATNKLYADELARARVEGAGRLGTTTAQGARRGLLGSDFGESQTRKTEDLNRQVEQSIEQERLAKISALMSDAQNDASARIKERRDAMLAGFDARRAYAADEENRKAINTQKAVKNLIAQGVSPDQIQGGQLSQFAKAYGISADELTANYTETKEALDAQQAQAEAEAQQQALENQKTQAEIAKIEAGIQSGKLIEMSEGTMLYDTITGQTFKNPKTSAPKTVSSSVSSGGGQPSGDVLRDADSVMSGVLNLQDISSAGNYRASVAAELRKNSKKALESGDIYGTMKASAAFDKEPSDTFLSSMEKVTNTLGQLGALQVTIDDVKTGPIRGAFKAKNPWSTKGQTIKAQLNAIVPNLARGVYGEVGVLTDNDIKTYSKTIPNLSATEDIRNAILYITIDMIRKNVENKIKNQSAGQRDMSGYADIYRNVTDTANSILETIPGSKIVNKFRDVEETPAPTESTTVTGVTESDPLGLGL